VKFRKDLFAIHPQVLAALEAFPWPGNVRQLENVVQHAVLVSTGPELLLTHLPASLQEQWALCSGSAQASEDGLTEDPSHRERFLIQQVLAQNDNSRARTASALGISRVTLYKKMRKHGLTGKPRPEGGNEALCARATACAPWGFPGKRLPLERPRARSAPSGPFLGGSKAPRGVDRGRGGDRCRSGDCPGHPCGSAWSTAMAPTKRRPVALRKGNLKTRQE